MDGHAPAIRDDEVSMTHLALELRALVQARHEDRLLVTVALFDQVAVGIVLEPDGLAVARAASTL
jgi:hypothetical protein